MLTAAYVITNRFISTYKSQKEEMKQEIKGRFSIEAAFIITGRGLVLSGKLKAGNVQAGDSIELEILNSKRKRVISGVDWGMGQQLEHRKIGLMIRCIDEAEIEELRAFGWNNTEADIYQTER